MAFVVNLTNGINDFTKRVHIKDLFEQFGEISAAWLPPVGHRHSEFGYIKFKRQQAAEAAVTACARGQVDLWGRLIGAEIRHEKTTNHDDRDFDAKGSNLISSRELFKAALLSGRGKRKSTRQESSEDSSSERSHRGRRGQREGGGGSRRYDDRREGRSDYPDRRGGQRRGDDRGERLAIADYPADRDGDNRRGGDGDNRRGGSDYPDRGSRNSNDHRDDPHAPQDDGPPLPYDDDYPDRGGGGGRRRRRREGGEGMDRDERADDDDAPRRRRRGKRRGERSGSVDPRDDEYDTWNADEERDREDAPPRRRHRRRTDDANTGVDMELERLLNEKKAGDSSLLLA